MTTYLGTTLSRFFSPKRQTPRYNDVRSSTALYANENKMKERKKGRNSKREELRRSKKELFSVLDSVLPLNSIKADTSVSSRAIPPQTLSLSFSLSFSRARARVRPSRAPVSSFSPPKGRSVSFLSVALKARAPSDRLFPAICSAVNSVNIRDSTVKRRTRVSSL